MFMRPSIIFIGNYKGGVGKTTSVLNFAEYFSRAKSINPAQKGSNRVLVLDIDPQSSLSEILVQKHYKCSLSQLNNQETLNYVFDLSATRIEKYPTVNLCFDSAEDTLIKSGDSYDFIPSSLFYRDSLGLDELVLRMKDNLQYLTILRDFLAPIQNKYDLILIDCPPTNNLITRSAFLLSDYYLVPTVLDGLSTNGVVHYINAVEETYASYCGKETEPSNNSDQLLARHIFGEKPQLLGVFFNMIRGQVNYDAAKAEFEAQFRTTGYTVDKILDSRINNYIDIARSTQDGAVSIQREDFKYLSQEILRRLAEY